MYGPITAVDARVFPDDTSTDWLGVRLVTPLCDIIVAIDDFQSCCERYGLTTYIDGVEGDPATLVGASVASVAWDGAFPLPEGYEMHTAPVRVVLEDGRIVHIVAWNEHNGYYCHYVRVAWNEYEDLQNI